MKETKNKKSENAVSFLADEVFYPHLKITNEKYPRLLATRKILNSTDEYFGAFLPKTAFRIWLAQLNKIFRLRSCQIEIDGTFPQPCQMFFNKKCVAPCVARLCPKIEYDDYVNALRLFLSGENVEFERFVFDLINRFSENLDFEKAAEWRDVWQQSQNLQNNKKYEINLANAVDAYGFEETDNETIFYLITTRGRRFLGNREFVFPKSINLTKEALLAAILKHFYPFQTPREIRVPFDFPERKTLEKHLRDRFKVQTKIIVYRVEPNKTAKMRLARAKNEHSLEKIGGEVSTDGILAFFQTTFALKQKPERIEAFDVAHVSNQDFITASAVWEQGKLNRDEAQHWRTDAKNEPEAMAQAVKIRLAAAPLPNLILIDGGRGQLNAVLKITDEKTLNRVSIISAVKPPGKHGEISHFLTDQGRRIEFDSGEKAFELLRNLRDEAHRAANELHRQYRINKYIFGANDQNVNENAELPLVVVRFDEPGGEAEDLQPIKTKI